MSNCSTATRSNSIQVTDFLPIVARCSAAISERSGDIKIYRS